MRQRIVTVAAIVGLLLVDAAPSLGQDSGSRWLDSNGQSAVSAVRAKRWVKPEIEGQLIDRGNGVYVQIQKADDQKDNHCVMDVPPTRSSQITGRETYRVRKAVNICE